MFHPGDQIVPGFKLVKFLGRGQFGEVWKALSPGGTHVALKFLDLSGNQGQKELRGVNRIKDIRHPHLVSIYALWFLDENKTVIDGFENTNYGPDSSQNEVRGTLHRHEVSVTQPQKSANTLVIATALCDQNLMQRLNELQSQSSMGIPTDELLGYVMDAAKAIDYLNKPCHDLGDGCVAIHHCDIKPENIMLLGGSAVVGDFGVARVFAPNKKALRGTEVGGSLAYAAPEIFKNRTEPNSDQYSLAITYYELRTGKLPFDDESTASVMHKKVLGDLDFAKVDRNERMVLRKATSVQSAKRYPSCSAFVEELAKAVASRRSNIPVRPVFAILVLAAMLTTVTLVSTSKLPDWIQNKILSKVDFTSSTMNESVARQTPEEPRNSDPSNAPISNVEPISSSIVATPGQANESAASRDRDSLSNGPHISEQVVTTNSMEPLARPTTKSIAEHPSAAMASIDLSNQPPTTPDATASAENPTLQSIGLIDEAFNIVDAREPSPTLWQAAIDLMLQAFKQQNELPPMSPLTNTDTDESSIDTIDPNLVIVDRLRKPTAPLLLYDRIDDKQIDLSTTAANELSEIKQAFYLGNTNSLLLCGYRNGETTLSQYWLRFNDNNTVIKRLESPYGTIKESISDGNEGFVTLRSDAITHCVRNSDRWSETELNDEISAVYPAKSSLTISPNQTLRVAVAPNRWLIVIGDRTPIYAIKLYDEDMSNKLLTYRSDRFAIEWKAPTKDVDSISISKNRLSVYASDGSKMQYNLQRILLVAEARLLASKSSSSDVNVP